MSSAIALEERSQRALHCKASTRIVTENGVADSLYGGTEKRDAATRQCERQQWSEELSKRINNRRRIVLITLR